MYELVSCICGLSGLSADCGLLQLQLKVDMEIAPWHAEELDSSRALVAAISDAKRIEVYFIFLLAIYSVAE